MTQNPLPTPVSGQARPMPTQIQPQLVPTQPMPAPQPVPAPQAYPQAGMPMPQPGGMPQPGMIPQPSAVPAPGAMTPMPSAAPMPMPAPGMPQQAAPGLPPMPGAVQQPGMPPMQMPSAGGDMGVPYQQPEIDPAKEGGERALPSISIQAFCERSETAAVIHEMSHDWRMKRTNLKIFMGGLTSAIEYYQKETTPGLIIVESGMRGDELFRQLDQLASVCDEGTQLVMVGAANDIKLYRRLMEKGVSEYIVPPFHPLNMIRTISDLFADPDKPFIGRVAAFFGSKGGVGSSTIAHNIAWMLSENMQQETALVDLDSSWGTTGLDFAYDATEGLEQALSDVDRLDETLLDRIMLRHTARLSILPASGTLGHAPVSDTDAYETVVNGVRSISPLTVLDMPHHWTDWTRNILTNADDVVITATPDLANLRNTKNLVDYLKSQRPNDAEPILILNKTGISKGNEITVADFAAAVGLEPALVIGFDPDSFIEASNDGKMLTEVKNAAQTVSGLGYVAHRLRTGSFPVADAGKARGGRFSLPGIGGGGKKEGGSGLSILSKFKRN